MYLVQILRLITAKLWYKYCSCLFCFTYAVSGTGNYVWYNGLLLTLCTFYFGRAELMKSGCPAVLSLVSLGQWFWIVTPLKSCDIRHWTQVSSVWQSYCCWCWPALAKLSVWGLASFCLLPSEGIGSYKRCRNLICMKLRALCPPVHFCIAFKYFWIHKV